MNFKTKLYAIAAVGLVSAILIGIIGLLGVHNILSINNEQDVLATVKHNVDDGDMMHDAIRADVLRAQLDVTNNDVQDLAEAKADLEEHAKRFRNNLAENTKIPLDKKTQALIKDIAPSLENYISQAETIFHLAETNPSKVKEKMPDFYSAFSALEKTQEELSSKIEESIKAKSEQSDQVNANAQASIAIMVVIFALALVVFSYWVIRGVMSVLGTDPENAQAIALRIARGDLEFSVSDSGNRNTLLGALSTMLTSLREGAAAARDNFRVKQALDATSTNVMMADNDRTIIYMNKAVQSMLQAAERDLQKVIPHFSAQKLMGSSMDVFHKNPSHQSTLLANLNSTYTGNIVVAGYHFRLIANPIFDAEGNRLGSVVEWQDRTKDVAFENEINKILSALDASTSNLMLVGTDKKIAYLNNTIKRFMQAAENDFRQVIPQFSAEKLKDSAYEPLNNALGTARIDLDNVSENTVVNALVAGRTLRLFANPIHAKDGTRLGTVIEWLDRTPEVAVEGEVNGVVKAASEGNFTARIPLEGKTGFFLSLAEGLNTLMHTADAGLGEVNRVLGAIAKGDLTEKITTDYAGTFGELKDYCNSTTDSLSTIIGEIRVAAETIFTASSEIAAGNADLSSRTEQQAANLEESASSMEELTSTVKLNADNAKQANVLAEQAATVATDGGVLIQEVVSTMNAINDSSQKIADIIGVIDGIAFQTNILALNAAVEAARAGDQGRGFAVVASEVRTLAQRSANAAKDIKGLISDSVKKIESGNTLVGKSGETMKNIVTAIKRVNDIMAEIAAASAEQSTGIEEVSNAVSHMDEMTQQNAALVEEAAAAAESLQTQADQLTQRVSQFKLSSQESTSNPAAPRLAAPSNAKKRLPSSSPSGSKPKTLAPPKQQDDEWESF